MNVIPKNYHLVFEPDLDKFVFICTEKITIKVTKPTDLITLHCAELKIESCSISTIQRTIQCITQTDKKNEELQIRLAEKINGTATIHIKFRGILNDRLLGFYRSKYTVGSQTKFLATTQFEAADARRAFPCWDEPAAKATFDISIITDRKFSAISNMPIISKTQTNGKSIHKFARTPIMSTYLVYLGVGEFEYLSGKAGTTKIRIITTKGNKSKGKFSLELGKKLLLSYEKYFGIKYPLPKLDLIAVPDFAAGAMENWGAITFRETILLYDPTTSSTRTKQFIAEVISHEIAHQWFGNLVTMKWWNDLWLNESFATFMAIKFVDMFYPEWDLWDQFLETAMNSAMWLDSLKSTHAIDVKVNSPAEIREIFDAISYDKGGCILRMLENFVGEPNFRKGLRQYLKNFKYGNATGDNLWDAIGKASKLPVRSIVNSWLTQPGFPLVEISRNKNNLHVAQQRYTLLPTKKPDAEVWSIPMTIGLSSSITKKLVRKTSTTVKIPPNTKGFVANYGKYGFYRVKYDKNTLSDIKTLMNQNLLTPTDRWAVQNDLFSLCISGDEHIRSYLDFVDAYYCERNYLVSVNVANNLANLYFRTIDEEFSREILFHSSSYFKHLFNNIGWIPRNTDRHTDALLRGYIITTLGKMGDVEVAEKASHLYKKFLKKPTSLPPDLIESVCSVAAWNGGIKVYSDLIRMYKVAKTAEEKIRFLGAVSSSGDKTLLKNLLDFAMTPAVRPQNVHLPVMRIAANPHGKKILWPWLRQNWKTLKHKIGHGNPLVNRIISSIPSAVDPSMEQEVRRFFRENPSPGAERTQTQVLERIRINYNFLKSVRREFKNA